MESPYFITPSVPFSPPPRKKPSKKLLYTGVCILLITTIATGVFFIYREFTKSSSDEFYQPLAESVIASASSSTSPPVIQDKIVISPPDAFEKDRSDIPAPTYPPPLIDEEEPVHNEEERNPSSTTGPAPSSSSSPVIDNNTKVNSELPNHPLEKPRIKNEEELFAMCPANSTAPELRLHDSSDNVTRFLQTTHSDDWKWVKYDPTTFDPLKAFKVGVSFEGHRIYLGRGIVCGDLVPANVDHDNHTAIVTFHNETFAISDFEVFIPADVNFDKKVDKIKGYGGRYPPNAIPIGITKRGQKLFTGFPFEPEGKVFDFPIGKIHPVNKVCYYPTRWNETSSWRYEVLAFNSLVPSGTGKLDIPTPTYPPPEIPRIKNEKDLVELCAAGSTAPELHLHDSSDNVTRFLQTTHSYNWKWVKYDPTTFDPLKAFKVGVSFEGHVIYLGRGIVCGDLVPANVDHDNHTAIVTFHDEVFAISDFEVFIPANMNFMNRFHTLRDEGGNYSTKAIPIGITKRGQKLFTGFPIEPGKNASDYDFPIGKIHPANKVCYFPTRSKETSSWRYQVFAFNPLGSSETGKLDLPSQTSSPPQIHTEEELFAMCPANSTAPELHLPDKSDNVTEFLRTTQSYIYKWIKYDAKTFDPSKAFKAGTNYQGHAIYLGRGIVCGDLVPANVDHDTHTAVVTFHYKTFTITDFEVLISTTVNLNEKIYKLNNGEPSFLKNAIPIGITKEGDKIFAGEPILSYGLKKEFPIGKVHPAHNYVCYYPTVSSGELDSFYYDVFALPGNLLPDIQKTLDQIKNLIKTIIKK